MGKTMLRSISIFTLWPAQKCQKLQIRGLCWQLPIPLRMQRKMGRWPIHNNMLWATRSSNSLSKNWFCNDLTSFFCLCVLIPNWPWFYPIGTNLIQCVSIWFSLIYFVPFWSVLIHFDLIWSIISSTDDAEKNGSMTNAQQNAMSNMF